MKHDRDIYTALFIALCVLAMIAGASIALLFIPSASAETLVCIAPEGQYVNVRKAPRSDAGVWGRLHAGDEIDAKGVESGFIRFVYGGSRAYVSVKLFEIPADCRYIVAADGRVRVRSAPGGDRVAWAEPGDAVQVALRRERIALGAQRRTVHRRELPRAGDRGGREMSSKTKIDWADATWNPVTGCLHGCEYCYAQRIARRFGGHIITGHDHLYILDKPYKRENGTITPYPYGFDPTFHRYKLDEPQRWKKPRSIFVCSMADLFGEWVPDEWILEVLQACQRAPQHRYIFLTKNPERYDELRGKYEIFREAYEKHHFGATATDLEQICGARLSCADWLSIEPFQDTIPPFHFYPYWRCIIIGAETGNRKGKVIPNKGLIMDIVHACDFWKTRVFMKESLRPIMGDDFRQDLLPWEVSP